MFDGTRAPYAEDAGFAPLSVYGASKAAGDLAAALVPRVYLLRTSWVIGDGKNFVRTMLDLGRRGVNPAVVSDQIGRPTFTAELARADRPPGRHPRRVRHLQRQQRRPARLVGRLHARDLSPGRAAQYGRRHRDRRLQRRRERPIAPRPLGSTLVLGKLEATGFAPLDWRQALGDYLAGGTPRVGR